MKKIKEIIYRYWKYLVLAALLYMPVFGYLNTMPVRIWDEARLAINAYEMYKNGDIIVTHFEGQPDMWNTKPPLLIWMQALLMKVIGVNELALRLPSAFAALATIFILLFFLIRYLKSFWLGFIVVMVLITSHGFINYHATRTGDYDAMLTLFTTLSGLLFFSFVETKKQLFLYLFFIVLSFAVLTKSINGLLFLPALLLYTLIRKQFISLLKNKHLYFGIFIFSFLTIGYYLLRESLNPGYIKAVMQNEFGGRFLQTIEGHSHGFWYYFNNFINFQFSIWYLFVPIGTALGLASSNLRVRKLTLYTFFMFICFFLIISLSKTKLEWYDVPLFPFLSILVGIALFTVFDFIKNLEYFNKRLTYNVLPFIFLFVVFIDPYEKIIAKTYKPVEYDWNKEFYSIGYFLKDAIKGKFDIQHHFLLYEGYYAQNLFYINILKDKGVSIDFKDWKNLQNGDKVIVSQPNIKQYLLEHYEVQPILNLEFVSTYEIIHGKQQ